MALRVKDAGHGHWKGIPSPVFEPQVQWWGVRDRQHRLPKIHLERDQVSRTFFVHEQPRTWRQRLGLSTVLAWLPSTNATASP
jgi:hypothetical protein